MLWKWTAHGQQNHMHGLDNSEVNPGQAEPGACQIGWLAVESSAVPANTYAGCLHVNAWMRKQFAEFACTSTHDVRAAIAHHPRQH